MPKLVFAKAGFFPPGGVFFYKDDANGIPLIQNRTNLESLIGQVAEAYEKAGKPAPQPLKAHIENFICENVPKGFCLGTYPANTPEFMTPQIVKRRSQEAAQSSPTRADPGTVLARMRICGTCPANAKTVCLSCTGLTSWAVHLAGRTKIGLDDAMGICLHDKVLLSLLPSLDLKAAERGTRPENCWRHNVPNVANDIQ
jgi:hypothetical protein